MKNARITAKPYAAKMPMKGSTASDKVMPARVRDSVKKVHKKSSSNLVAARTKPLLPLAREAEAGSSRLLEIHLISLVPNYRLPCVAGPAFYVNRVTCHPAADYYPERSTGGSLSRSD